MKIIELLNRIANGIDIPLQIKYDNNIWKYDEMARDYLLIDKSGEEYLICEELNLLYALNEVVEVVEEEQEDKKIEKIDEILTIMCDDLKDKIKEIVDKINKEKNNENN